MIRKPNNWNEVKEFTDRPKLPVDAYVCRVKKAVVQTNSFGEQLCLLFDIVEGEYKDFFNKEFQSNTQENKKWKGVLRLWLPKEDGSEQDGWTKSTLKGMVTAIEKSNNFAWNWDEASLAGKLIGILFRNEEWEYDGKTGWSARPFRALSVDTVRSGDYNLPKDKPLKNKTAPADSGFGVSNNNTNDFGGFGNYGGSDGGNSLGGFYPMPDDSEEFPF